MDPFVAPWRLRRPFLFLIVSSPARAQQNPTTPATQQAAAQTHADAQNAPQPRERAPRYKVQRSGCSGVTFPLTPEFNLKVMVEPDGYISLQGTNSISVLGMTLPEVNLAIKNAYAKVLHEPVLQVDLTEFQKPYFIVTGQVTKPGQYDLRSDITVSEAIGIAGGFLPTAKTQVFLYHRNSTGWVEAKELKLKDFLHGKNVNEDSDMRPGDMIFVPKKPLLKSANTFLIPSEHSFIRLASKEIIRPFAIGKVAYMNSGDKKISKYQEPMPNFTMRDLLVPVFRHRKQVLAAFSAMFVLSLLVAWLWASQYYVSRMQVVVQEK